MSNQATASGDDAEINDRTISFYSSVFCFLLRWQLAPYYKNRFFFFLNL